MVRFKATISNWVLISTWKSGNTFKSKILSTSTKPELLVTNKL